MDSEFLQQIDNVSDLLRSSLNEKLDDEILICECFCVNVRDIREVCSASQEVSIPLLQERLSLGHGCQSCLKNSEFWIDKIF